MLYLYLVCSHLFWSKFQLRIKFFQHINISLNNVSFEITCSGLLLSPPSSPPPAFPITYASWDGFASILFRGNFQRREVLVSRGRKESVITNKTQELKLPLTLQRNIFFQPHKFCVADYSKRSLIIEMHIQENISITFISVLCLSEVMILLPK